MKTEHLMDCIGQIDDRIIAEADNSTPTSTPAKRPWIKWGAAAAAPHFIQGRLAGVDVGVELSASAMIRSSI